MPKSQWEEELWLLLKHYLPQLDWVREHKFHPTRKWRFDFANLETMTAIEVEGVTYFGKKHSRHQTTRGFRSDCEKYNEAGKLGWTILRYPHIDVKSGFAWYDIKKYFDQYLLKCAQTRYFEDGEGI